MPPEHEKDLGSNAPCPADLLSEAYRTRTDQLYEARSTLAEAVAVLKAELTEQRREAREQSDALRQALESAQLRNQALQAELDGALSVLATVQQMKVVRWSAPARRWVYRLRIRRR